MSWKKIVSLILVLSIVFLTPVTKGYADENKDDSTKTKSPDEIIKKENTPSSDDIPDPPKEESLIGEEDDVYEVEIETPSSVTGEKMEGTGTVVDFSTTGARAFYTIVDNDNKTFYLIIDMDKAENNVYFLSDINSEELEGNTTSKSNKNNVSNKNDEEDSDMVTVSKEELKNTQTKEEGSSNLGFLAVVVTIGLIGALGYHFLIRNRKQKNVTENSDENDEDDDMPETYEDEGMYTDQELIDEKIREESEQETESDNK